MGDIVVGHDTLAPYLHNDPYLGAIVGRYANRIARGRFRLDGIEYQLATNDGANHLHGGVCGFDRQLWSARSIATSEGAGVRFTRVSASGEEGYPGRLDVSVTYLATHDGTLLLRYDATTDADTIINLTQHSYFNLAGERSTSVLDHELTVYADRYTPVEADLIPTGAIEAVTDTPFDFRTASTISSRVTRPHEQLRRAGGFDHNFVLNGGAQLAHAATLRDTASGRTLEIHTTEPGLQFYDGHLLDGRTTAAYGRVLQPHAGLCLETQHFPDSPNQPQFPSVTLERSARYQSLTMWRFGAT